MSSADVQRESTERIDSQRDVEREHFKGRLYERALKFLAQEPSYYLKADALEFELAKLLDRRGYKPPNWFSQTDRDNALTAASERARKDFKTASNGKVLNGASGGAADDGAVPYFESEGGIWRRVFKQNGEATADRLTNFTARIVEERANDDGGDLRLTYLVTTCFEGRTSQCEIPADEFNSMDWVVAHLPTSAGVLPGRSTKEHAAWAIRQLSGSAKRVTKYGHRGWRKLDGGHDGH